MLLIHDSHMRRSCREPVGKRLFRLAHLELWVDLHSLDVKVLILFLGIIVSRLIIHSFDRVIRRQEDEELIRNLTSWDPTYRARPMSSHSYARFAVPSRPWTPAGARLQPRVRRREPSPTTVDAAHDIFDEGSSTHHTHAEPDRFSIHSGISREHLVPSLGWTSVSHQTWVAERHQTPYWTGETPTITPTSPGFVEDVWTKPPGVLDLSPNTPDFAPTSKVTELSHMPSRTLNLGHESSLGLTHPLDQSDQVMSPVRPRYK
jgi:hypothetical protein